MRMCPASHRVSRPKRPFFSLLIHVVLYFFLSGSPVQADTRPSPPSGITPVTAQKVTVGVYISPPFIMKQGNDYTGMAIDLWHTLAYQAGLVYEFREFSSNTALLDALEARQIDVAVNNLSITEERARKFDFTFPWYDAGLRILVNNATRGSAESIFNGLFRSGYIVSYLWITAIILFSTLMLTLLDRKYDRDFPPQWGTGLSESFYHVISVIATGKTSHKPLFGAFGRLFSAVWMLCGVAVIAYITSSVTSIMTTEQLKNQVSGLRDLSGKIVGVREGSLAEAYLKEQGFQTAVFNHLKDAIPSLTEGKIVAVVADAPVLEYYVNSTPGNQTRVVGNLFHPDKYAFALPQGSPLTKTLSLSIIRNIEQGNLTLLRERYFGEHH